MKLESLRHLAIEGPIGVGKTSLARRLAAHLGAELLLEKPEDNPFLPRFYEDGSRHALQTQLFFLFQRVEQVQALSQPGMFSPRIVSDFMFAKDELFARLTLSDDEYRLYAQVHRHVTPALPRPDLVLWLQAGPAALQRRIHRRGIAMEQGIADDYLARLSAAYADHFERDPGLPVLAVPTEAFHPAADEADFQRLLQAIAAFRGPRETMDDAARL